MTDKEAQLKAKLLKMRLAVKSDGVTTAKGKVNKLKKKYVDPNPQAETPEEIRQSAESAGREPTYIAQEHNHKISFRGHKIGGFKGASLNGQSGKYAKYWLLNAKETNGNGWGIAAHTAKENMKKFIGRPLVVTAQSWHGASEYGDEYEHPYLPTNDINAILNHQEKFRVGSIVDVFEDKHGDWYASIEMLPKFASSRLPPFCSPAIYQLDASEAEGQISKWEALHLAALTENPAYGARIALLKGTCVGTDNECKVQFKSAKDKKPTTFKRKLGTSRGFRESPASRSNKYNPSPTGSQGNMLDLISKNAPKKQTKVVDTPDRKFYNDNGEEISRDEYNKQAKIICPKKLKERISKLKKKQKISKLKTRLAFEDLSGSNEGDVIPKEPYKLHSRSKEIEEHGLKTIGESDNFNGGHFLTTNGRLIGNGKLEHRDMSDSILKTFDDKDYDDMAINSEDYISFPNDMRELLRNTGMARVSTGLPDDGSIPGYQQGIYIDTSHPLSKKQRSRITQYLEDNNVSPDNVFIDDYTNTQSIRKQLRLGKLNLN